MKKLVAALLAFAMLFALCACAPNVTAESSQEELEKAFLGKTIGEVHRAFGDPDSFLSGLWGEIYRRGENEMVIFYYESVDGGYNDDSGVVTEIHITERQI